MKRLQKLKLRTFEGLHFSVGPMISQEDNAKLDGLLFELLILGKLLSKDFLLVQVQLYHGQGCTMLMPL